MSIERKTPSRRPAARKRRSPEEARAVVLEVAERRLAQYGLEGLNIVDVARDAGITHATLLHHFGSTEDMRRELVSHMTTRLLSHVLEALRQPGRAQPAQVLSSLFDELSSGGHAKLLAWLAVGGPSLSGAVARPSAGAETLFREILPALTRHLPEEWTRDGVAERLVFLVATAAIGYGVSGAVLGHMTGLDPDEVRDFPRWLGDQLDRLVNA
jgi:AcrR family transcriptional regulator